MNRTDQAAEPSMEEILASIRSIISDDGRAEAGREMSERPAAAARPQSPVQRPLPEDEVLDLTEEFVFPEDQASASASTVHTPSFTSAAESMPAPASARSMPAASAETTPSATQ